MKQNLWCKFLNLHKYEVIKETCLTDAKNNMIGYIYVSRCTNCGKIKHTRVYTEKQYGE